jgi:hypothetical protein
MAPKSLSRRGFLKSAAVGAGAAVGARFAPGARSMVGDALAATGETPHVLVVYTLGGYNSIFCSAKELQGTFGVTATNYTALGGGLTVDNTYANAFDAFSKSHMAAIGVRHGISAHAAARLNTISSGQNNYVLMLADALGGTAPIKCAFLGNNNSGIANMPTKPINGVSLQTITDMKPAIDALGGGAPDPRTPDRAIAAGAIGGSQAMSSTALAASPNALSTVADGYATSIDTLQKPAQKLDFATLATAYGMPAGRTAIANNDFKAKMAAAELMMLAGANVVWTIEANPGWDTHNDRTGTRVRNQMTSYLLPPLATFTQRMLQAAGRNVVVLIVGDFARSLPGSDHQPNLSVTVMGKYVKQGTTGKVYSNVALPPGTPGSQQMWSYVAAVAKAPKNPFGANPHNLVL